MLGPRWYAFIRPHCQRHHPRQRPDHSGLSSLRPTLDRTSTSTSVVDYCLTPKLVASRCGSATLVKCGNVKCEWESIVSAPLQLWVRRAPLPRHANWCGSSGDEDGPDLHPRCVAHSVRFVANRINIIIIRFQVRDRHELGPSLLGGEGLSHTSGNRTPLTATAPSCYPT